MARVHEPKTTLSQILDTRRHTVCESPKCDHIRTSSYAHPSASRRVMIWVWADLAHRPKEVQDERDQ